MWEKVEKKQGPIYRQIMEQIMREIESGRINPGDQLESERKLGQYFGVNRSTVVHALEELRELGVLTSKRGSGWFVNQTEWGKFAVPRIDWRQMISPRYEQTDWYEQKIKEAKQSQKTLFLDLYASEMPNELLPNFEFPSYSLEEILAEEKEMDLLGYTPLRNKIKRYLESKFELTFSLNQLLVTGGGQQAIFLILQTILSAGEGIAVESPSFFYRLPLFKASGTRLFGIPMDEEGIDLEKLKESIHNFKASGTRLFGIPMDEEGIDLEKLKESIHKNKLKAVLINPNFQNPTGKVMSQKRREKLVELCRQYRLPIIEDDVFTDLSFLKQDEVLPIRTIDPDNVLYVGSLSRILGKTTKIGWLIGPETFILQLAKAQEMMEFPMNILTQITAANVFDEAIDLKMLDVRKKLKEKSQLISIWAESQSFFKLHSILGGYYAWITWDGKKLDLKLAEKVVDMGLGIAPSLLFGQDINGIRINYSRLDEANISLFYSKMKILEQWLTE